ncbi:serine/threonine-protein kinase CTR1-like [Forsythia ovata]|uniref:Serine/threonine-protein kinase CTR1-like n=1 Tax=Forsythia ovata TaxID=205694 RepID=A0ABD1TUZ3_9LAMI
MIHPPLQSRMGTETFPMQIGLQRQSSRRSFGDSSISGDYYVPPLSNPEIAAFGHMRDGCDVEMRVKAAEMSSVSGGGSSLLKSWAQLTVLPFRSGTRDELTDFLTFFVKK